MRLIDADKLLEKVKPFGLSNGSTLGYHSGVAEIIVDIIESIPTVEAEPVLRGIWEEFDCDCICTPVGYFCSECGRAQTYESKYCPTCGAKMYGV